MIIKGVGMREGRRREATEEVLGVIGEKVEIEEIKRIGGKKVSGKGEEMVLVKLG